MVYGSMSNDNHDAAFEMSIVFSTSGVPSGLVEINNVACLFVVFLVPNTASIPFIVTPFILSSFSWLNLIAIPCLVVLPILKMLVLEYVPSVYPNFEA